MRYGFRILVVIFFLLPFIFMGTNRTFQSNSNNVADWLPDSFAETRQYQEFLRSFPYERFVVVSWKGCTMDDSRLEMFAQKLVPGQTIDNIGRWEEQPITAEIDPNAPAAGTTPPEENRHQQEIPIAVDENVPPKYASYFKTVITGPRLFRLFKDMYSAEGPGGVNLTDDAIKQKLRGILVGPDGQNTALIVTLTQEAPHGKKLSDVLDAIKEIGRECGVHPQVKEGNRFFLVAFFQQIGTVIKEIIYGRNPNLDGVIMGGPPVDNVAITQEGEQTLKRLAGLCGLIGLGLAWLCFRDFRLTFFVFWTAIISAGVALASVSFTGGTCDAILLSMPALVYVLAMSGAIHLINYYHDAVREGGLDMAPEKAVRHAWTPCLFANITTAIGLGSLAFSGLIPISKFGLYSALGVLLQLLLLFYYLPTLLYFYPSHKIAAQQTLNIENNSAMQKIWHVWGGLMIRYCGIVTVVCFILMIYFGFGLLNTKTSVKMMRFFAADSEIIHHYTWLEEHLGPLVPMEIVVKFDNERCQQMNTLERLRLIAQIDHALRNQNETLRTNIGGVISAVTMTPLPPKLHKSGKKGPALIVEERAMNKTIDNNRSELRDYIAVDGNLSLEPGEERRKALDQLGITAEDADRLTAAGIGNVRKLADIPDNTELAGISSEEMKTFREKAAQWERTHGYDLWRISLRVWSLKKDIDYALFIKDVKDVVDPIVAEANQKQHFDVPAIDAVYTGMVPVVYKTQHELLNGLVWSFGSSFILIGITMAVILRNWAAGFLAMIPNLFPVFIVFGFMGYCGILVDVGTMMTASVALGISVDDTIHFLTWFRHGIDMKMSRATATRYAYSRCATSMFQTSVIGGLGLSAFALSTFTPTQMFGIMMLAILMVAMLGDLIFLAALLNTPLGRVFMPKEK
ncbi:MAG: MMPL family transporter [Planctomycetaceae bacterium]|jgi:predicted RND superfamily exporter protein|nr:MMPL family transporter [Planctomycetaceae bacterium]